MALPGGAHAAGLRRVVVTGAAGFIGSHLVERLLSYGTVVVGIDRRDLANDHIAAGNLADASADPRFLFVHEDLLDCPLDSLFADVDAVFHLAGLPGVRPSWGERFPEYVETNVIATQRIMDAAIRARVPRVVMASSSSVYGCTDGWPTGESAPTEPISPYGVTKLAAESLCLAYAHRSDSRTGVAAMRYFTAYGPRQRPDMLIGRVLEASLGGPPLQLYGNGVQCRDFTFVSDVVDATLAAATRSSKTAVFNVGTGRATSVQDVVRVAEEVTGLPVPVLPGEVREGDVPATLADTTRAHSELGWQPRMDLVSGLQAHWNWVRDRLVQAAGESAS